MMKPYHACQTALLSIEVQHVKRSQTNRMSHVTIPPAFPLSAMQRPLPLSAAISLSPAPPESQTPECPGEAYAAPLTSPSYKRRRECAGEGSNSHIHGRGTKTISIFVLRLSMLYVIPTKYFRNAYVQNDGGICPELAKFFPIPRGCDNVFFVILFG